MTETISIMLGGPASSTPSIPTQENDDKWIGVDHGAIHLIESGIIPTIAIGDFDSVTKKEKAQIDRKIKDVRLFPSEKDNTDAELAVQLAFNELNAEQVFLYGATGGRLDHLLSNLFMILQPQFIKYASKIKIIDVQNTLSFYLPGKHKLKKETDKAYIAFICLTPVKKLTLKKMKYSLEKESFASPISLASNEFLDETAYFSFEKGIIAVVQSKDKVKET